MNEYWQAARAVSAITAGALFFCALLFTGIARGVRPFDESKCDGFGMNSGYEVRFVDYNFFSWDCLAKTANGKWISTQNLRGVNQ